MDKYKCFKRLIKWVIETRIAYAKGDMKSAAKYYTTVYNEFDECKNEFWGEDNADLWKAYNDAMVFLSDDEVYEITDYIKKTTGYYD